MFGKKQEENTRNAGALAAVKEQPSQQKTKIIVKYDIGFKNTLHIRGNLPGLSWSKGTPMKNVKADEWIWETDKPFAQGEFKVLVNDISYEAGNNHQVKSGSNIQYTPKF